MIAISTGNSIYYINSHRKNNIANFPGFNVESTYNFYLFNFSNKFVGLINLI